MTHDYQKNHTNSSSHLKDIAVTRGDASIGAVSHGLIPRHLFVLPPSRGGDGSIHAAGESWHGSAGRQRPIQILLEVKVRWNRRFHLRPFLLLHDPFGFRFVFVVETVHFGVDPVGGKGVGETGRY